MKLGKGMGSITKLKGKLYKPYMVRDSLQNGRKPLGYFATKKEALEFLVNKSEHKELSNISFKEVYEKASDERYGEGIKTDGRKHMNTAFNHCKVLWEKPMSEVTIEDIERFRSSAKIPDASKKRVKEMFSMMYDYAVRHDIVSREENKRVVWKIDKKTKRVPILLTKEEIERLIFRAKKCDARDFALILLYTGMRPQELLKLETANIDLKSRKMVGGMKTEKGTNRAIPIHRDILPVIKKRLEEAQNNGSETLFSTDYTQTMNNIAKRDLPELMERIQFRDLRHQFQTRCRECKVDEKVISDIVGHSDGNNITLSVYTHLSWGYVLEEVDKLWYAEWFGTIFYQDTV